MTPQYPQFEHRLRIIRSQLGLLTTQPLSLELGFERLAVDQPQSSKLDSILRQADAEQCSEEASPRNHPNLLASTEKTLTDGLRTRAALRAVLTPMQND